jgi:hypothetical protein
MHQALLREDGERQHPFTAAQLDRQVLGVTHTGGHDFEHLGAAAVLLEAHQVGLHGRAEQRHARAGRALGRLGVHLSQVAVVGARPHQLGFTGGQGRVEEVTVCHPAILTHCTIRNQSWARPRFRGWIDSFSVSSLFFAKMIGQRQSGWPGR